MANPKKNKRKQIQSLKKAHDRRAMLVSKVESAREKLERAQLKHENRRRKLQAVEAQIAELSQAVYGEPASELLPTLADTPNTTTPDGTSDSVRELPDDPAASE